MKLTLVRFTSDNDQTGDIERVAAIVFTGIQKPAQQQTCSLPFRNNGMPNSPSRVSTSSSSGLSSRNWGSYDKEGLLWERFRDRSWQA